VSSESVRVLPPRRPEVGELDRVRSRSGRVEEVWHAHGGVPPTQPDEEEGALGYAWADFGPAGGSFLMRSSGPPVTLLATAALPEGDPKLRGGAADRAAMGAEGLAARDRCLGKLVASCDTP
jgi:hypothetical protein